MKVGARDGLNVGTRVDLTVGLVDGEKELLVGDKTLDGAHEGAT